MANRCRKQRKQWQTFFLGLQNHCRWCKSKSLSHAWLFATSQTLHSKEFSRPEYGVGNLSLLQGIFQTQGSNPYRQILYQLSHKGSPRKLEWVAYPFSSRSSQPRNWTRVSWIADGFFTNWAIREVLQMVTAAIKLKDTCSLEEKLWQT